MIAGVSDSFTVDWSALGRIPQAIADARGVVAAIDAGVSAAVARASVAAGSAAGNQGIAALGAACRRFVDAGVTALDRDAARLDETAAAYASADQGVARAADGCGRSLAGGSW